MLDIDAIMMDIRNKGEKHITDDGFKHDDDKTKKNKVGEVGQ